MNEFQGLEIVHLNKVNVLVVDTMWNMELLSEIFDPRLVESMDTELADTECCRYGVLIMFCFWLKKNFFFFFLW